MGVQMEHFMLLQDKNFFQVRCLFVLFQPNVSNSIFQAVSGKLGTVRKTVSY